jgi:Zn finger protein HypA/HybF involved in hydrogenase expression
MHERHLASDLVRAAGVVAVEGGAGHVVAITLRIGSLSHVDPESLRHQIEWHARGTVVEGARVEFQPTPPFSPKQPDRHADEVVLVSIDVGE